MGECRGSVTLGKWPKGHSNLWQSPIVDMSFNESRASTKTELDINSLMQASHCLQVNCNDDLHNLYTRLSAFSGASCDICMKSTESTGLTVLKEQSCVSLRLDSLYKDTDGHDILKE